MKNQISAKRSVQIALALALAATPVWGGETAWTTNLNSAIKSVLMNPAVRALKSGLPVSLAAEDDPSSAAPNSALAPSIYDQLKADFDRGTLPSKANLNGWYMGRCYSNEPTSSPYYNVPGINVLIGKEIPSQEITPEKAYDNGPKFPDTIVPPVTLPGKLYFGVELMNDAEVAAGGRALTPVGRMDLWRIQNEEGDIPLASIKDASLSATASIYTSQIYNARKNGRYIVVQMTTTLDSKDIDYCYFFPPNLRTAPK